jgi:hypothetical protein
VLLLPLQHPLLLLPHQHPVLQHLPHPQQPPR